MVTVLLSVELKRDASSVSSSFGETEIQKVVKSGFVIIL